MKVPKTALPSEKEFLLLLQDRAFVDYFNVFLSLPVFGQRIMYQFHNRAFSFDPPLKKNKGKCYPDRVVDFLRTERYQLFLTTALFLEYQLYSQLRNTHHDIVLCYGEEQLDSSKYRQLLDFLIGHVIGMQFFRRSLIDTTGHDAYCCWLDLEKFRVIPETDSEREEQFRHIKATYFVCGAPHELARDKIMIALTGLVNFEVLFPDARADRAANTSFDALTDDNFTLASPHPLRALQTALITSLKCYWLPRYVNHILQTMPHVVLCEILKNEWNPETDSTCLHVKIMFEHLFPQYELELDDTITPSVVTSTIESQVNIEAEITEDRACAHRYRDTNEMMEVSEFVPGSCTLERAENDVEMVISETDSVGKEDLSDRLGMQPSTSLASGDGVTRHDLTDSGDIGDTNSRKSNGSLWTPFSASMGDTLYQPPTYYSLYSSSSDSNDYLTPFLSHHNQIQSQRPMGAGGKDRFQRMRRKRARVKLNELRSSEFNWPPDIFERIVCFYIHGSVQRKLSLYEKRNKRFTLAMGAETLAGFPFRGFLSDEKRRERLDCLDFWEAIREYLCTDNSAIGGASKMSKSVRAAKIMERFLLESSVSSVPLSTQLKQALYLALVYDSCAETLYDSQDMMLQTLQETWREYRSVDREYFISSTCWKPYRRYLRWKQKNERGDTVLRNMEIYDQRKNYNEEVVSIDFSTDISPPSGDAPPLNLHQPYDEEGAIVPAPSTEAWPELLSSRGQLRSSMRSCMIFGEETIMEVDEEPDYWTGSDGGSAKSGSDADVELESDEQVDINILNEQHQKMAFQLAVACIYPQATAEDRTIEDFFTMLEGNYGSLTKPTPKHNPPSLLTSLTRTRTYDVANLKVARIFLYEPPAVPKDSTFDAKTFLLRKNGEVMPRPPRPRTFRDIMADPDHMEYFRRYLSSKKAATPLKFWKAVEDLKETERAYLRQKKLTSITRQYFSKHANFGSLLECTDDVVKQISVSDKVTFTMMVSAQGAVCRSMERRWFYEYLDSYPDAEDWTPSLSTRAMAEKEVNEEEVKRVEDTMIGTTLWLRHRTSVPNKRKLMWLRLAGMITHFVQCTKHPIMMKLFDMFLRIQLRREADKANGYAERSYKTMLNSRLIVLNKLPRDLAFWVEINRFKSLIDNLSGRGTTDDRENIRKKAKAVIDCFLASEVLPRLQINIIHEMAVSVISVFQNKGPMRSMFHEATISLFPILFHYWKSCELAWGIRTLSEEELDNLYDRMTNELYRQTNCTPHRTVDIPCYTDLTTDDYQTGYGYVQEENHIRMNFTLMHGLRVIYPFTTTRGSFIQSRMHMHLSRMSRVSQHQGISRTSVMGNFRQRAGSKRDSNIFLPIKTHQIVRRLSPIDRDKKPQRIGSLAPLILAPTIKIESLDKTTGTRNRSRAALSAIPSGTTTAPLSHLRTHSKHP